MNTLEITLPHPPRILSPNGRPGHYMQKARATKKYRRDAVYATMHACSAKGQEWELHLPKATVQATFYYRLQRRRDPDNLLASIKAAFDGLVKAGLLKDDNGLTHLPTQVAIDKADPRVVLTVTWE